jgi:hypothetical protein
MGVEFLGFAALSRAELAHRIMRIVAIRRLQGADLVAMLGMDAAAADALARGRVHQFTAEQLRAHLNGLCQRSPERRR